MQYTNVMFKVSHPMRVVSVLLNVSNPGKDVRLSHCPTQCITSIEGCSCFKKIYKLTRYHFIQHCPGIWKMSHFLVNAFYRTLLRLHGLEI